MRKVVYILLVFFVFGQQASNITPTSKETEKKLAPPKIKKVEDVIKGKVHTQV